MFFFQQLELIGIDSDQLKGKAANNLIAVEKKLIAEHRLNQTISKNEIQEILFILKNYKTEIRIICIYESLYSILAGKEPRFLDNVHVHNAKTAAGIQNLLSNYFSDTIAAYFNQHFSAGNWYKLSLLFRYPDLLSYTLKEPHIIRIEEKLLAALDLLESKPAVDPEEHQLYWLADENFYHVLASIHSFYFREHVHRLTRYLRVIASHAPNTFWKKVIYAHYEYSPFDRNHLVPGYDIQRPKASRKEQFENWALLFLFFSPFLFIVLLCNQQRDLPTIRKNTYMSEDRYEYKRTEYDAENQEIELLNFDEARQYTQNNPPASRNGVVLIATKYRNPFLFIHTFRDYYGAIRSGKNMLNVFNQTDEECFALAIYNLASNGPFSGPVDIYPLYIPPNDSVSILFPLECIRFYTGKDLKRFNAYRFHKYADSVDAKFAIVSKLDSALFCRQFRFEFEWGKEVPKVQSLILSKPHAKAFKLDWKGTWKIRKEAAARDPRFKLDSHTIHPGGSLYITWHKKRK